MTGGNPQANRDQWAAVAVAGRDGGRAGGFPCSSVAAEMHAPCPVREGPPLPPVHAPGDENHLVMGITPCIGGSRVKIKGCTRALVHASSTRPVEAAILLRSTCSSAADNMTSSEKILLQS